VRRSGRELERACDCLQVAVLLVFLVRLSSFEDFRIWKGEKEREREIEIERKLERSC